MQLGAQIALVCAGLASAITPAEAQICTVVLGTGGTLALSSDGTRLGSDELGGISGSLTVASVGTNTLTIGAPSRVSGPPAGYDFNAEQVEVAYRGLGGLNFIDQSYTSSSSNIVLGTIAASVLEVDNRIVNPNGFASGSYTTRTVVTCN